VEEEVVQPGYAGCSLSQSLVPLDDQALCCGETKVEVVELASIHTYDLDLVRVAGAKAAVVSNPDVIDRHRIKTHYLRCHRIDGHLVLACKQNIADIGLHRPWTGAVATDRTIHDRKDPGVDLLLDREEIYQHLMDHLVSVVAVLRDQAPKSVLYCPGGGRVAVGLDGWKMDDVTAKEGFGDEDLSKEIIHREHLGFRRKKHPFNVGQGLILDAVPLENREPLVVVCTLPGMGDHGLVLDADNILVAILSERREHSIKLPGRRGARRIKQAPGEVDLQYGFLIPVNTALVTSTVHQGAVIFQHRLRGRSYDTDR